MGKNALEYTKGGTVQVIIEPDKVTVVVIDQGQGFENLSEADYCSSPDYGHGLSQVREYSDEFMIETNGKKYVKTKNDEPLIEMGNSDIQHGSKITSVKNLR